jgi:hypothetical protein
VIGVGAQSIDRDFPNQQIARLNDLSRLEVGFIFSQQVYSLADGTMPREPTLR